MNEYINNEIQHEQKAMIETIPLWEWDDEYENIYKSLARQKLNNLYGGEKNDI